MFICAGPFLPLLSNISTCRPFACLATLHLAPCLDLMRLGPPALVVRVSLRQAANDGQDDSVSVGNPWLWA